MCCVVVIYLLNAFAIYVDEVTVLSLKVIVEVRCVAHWLVCQCY